MKLTHEELEELLVTYLYQLECAGLALRRVKDIDELTKAHHRPITNDPALIGVCTALQKKKLAILAPDVDGPPEVVYELKLSVLGATLAAQLFNEFLFKSVKIKSGQTLNEVLQDWLVTASKETGDQD